MPPSRMERNRLGSGFSWLKLAAESVVHRRCVRPYSFASLLIFIQLAFAGSISARAQEPEKPLQDLANASDLWLRSRVIPNAVVPAPEPTRRGLLLSYEFSPEKFPRLFHRSATYDDALAALAFLTLGEREEAASTLDALARLVRPEGSLWFSYNTADDWPSEANHDTALVRGQRRPRFWMPPASQFPCERGSARTEFFFCYLSFSW